MTQVLSIGVKFDIQRGRTVLYDIPSGDVLFEATERCNELCNPQVLADKMINSIQSYEVVDHETIEQEFFDVTSVGREDIAACRGINPAKAFALTDGSMEYIARKLGEALSEDYAISLPIIVEYAEPDIELTEDDRQDSEIQKLIALFRDEEEEDDDED